jgi:hypothetical protein
VEAGVRGGATVGAVVEAGCAGVERETMGGELG